MTVDDLIEKSRIEPRPYQKRVINNTLKHFLDDIGSVMIESPTGSGKTVMGLSICKLLQLSKGLSVGWVAMRRNLLAQAQQENHDMGINANIEYISMFEQNPPKVDLLVIDEAQHDATDSCSHLHNSIKPKFILGLSATPFRADRAKLCFAKIVKDAGLRMLIREGWLAQFDHYTIPEWSPEKVAQHYLNRPDKWGKTIMFFHTLKDCFKAQECLAEKGISVDVVTGSSDRETQIANFEQDVTKVLINCMVLTEGFDCPSIQTAFVRPSSKGVTIQMAGRAFRKFPGLPVKNIVQCRGTPWPFTKSADPIYQYVWKEDFWYGLQTNENAALARNVVLHSIAKIETKLPSLLTDKKKKRNTFR